MQRVYKLFCRIMIIVVIFSSISGCSKTRNVYVEPANSKNPSWSADNIKFAQEFREALESGEESEMPSDMQDDLYNVTIETDLGHWEFELYISLNNTNQDAFSKDESGVVRKISQYNTTVIRQIFSDVVENGTDLLT